MVKLDMKEMYITGCWKNYLISTVTLAQHLYIQDEALLLVSHLKSQFGVLILCRAFIDLKNERYLIPVWHELQY